MRAKQPSIESLSRAARDVRDALIVALALHLQHARRGVEVLKVVPDGLAPAEAPAIQYGEQGGVPRAAGRLGIAHAEERAKLTAGQSTPARNTDTSDRLDVSDTLVVFGTDLTAVRTRRQLRPKTKRLELFDVARDPLTHDRDRT